MTLHTVYLLRSSTNERKTYVGYTERAIAERLDDHNAGRVPSTARHRPWILVVALSTPDKWKALDLERYVKSGSGHAFARRHLW